MTRRALHIAISVVAILTSSTAGGQNYCPDTTIVVSASPGTGEETYTAPLSTDEWDQNFHNVSAICRGETTPRGTTLPATCTIGQLFFDTDTSAGSNIYGCTSPDTWTLQSGGGGGGGATIEIIDLQKSSAQSINSGSVTALTWETEREDLGGYHAASSTDIVIPTGKAGVFSIQCGATFASSFGGRVVEVREGGTAFARNRAQTTLNVTVARTRRLADAAVITCAAFQDSGSAIDVNAVDTTFFVVTRLGD